MDTNVISELTRPKPEPGVTRWIDATEEKALFLSVLTMGEIRKGIVLRPDGPRRKALEAWLRNDLPIRFSGRILGIDRKVADRWGSLCGLTAAVGANLAVIDGLLAATAAEHDLTLVTRNTKDVMATGVPLLNPWVV